MIKREGKPPMFVLYSKDGSRKLGSFKTRKEAEMREKRVMAVKQLKK
tara:strand:- start:266 stop:406 length:141 start_codon:yes stop_codon:yes gene_type:complete